jgi:hypothetical protein
MGLEEYGINEATMKLDIMDALLHLGETCKL